jgi:hypothetical protein
MKYIKKIILGLFVSCNFINLNSCDINNNNIQELNQVIGEWEMYRDENLETVIDQWTGTDWTTKDDWFANIRQDSQIILSFNPDGTFQDKYASVSFANGVWKKINEKRYYFDYVQEAGSINENLIQRRYINFYCDNTFSVEVEGNLRRIEYYRKMNTNECSDLIVYNVID